MVVVHANADMAQEAIGEPAGREHATLARTLGIAPGALGAVLSAALAGLAVGGLALAPLADRVGRRTILGESVIGLRPDVPLPVRGVPVRRLFDRGRLLPTVLLWAASFAVFLVLVVNSSWTPTLLAPLGLPVASTALALALFNAGSVVATAAGGWLLARFGARAVIPPAFVLGAVGVVGVGLAAPSLAGVAAAQVLVGLGLGAASSAVVAMAAVSYPTAIRSTGVGATMGIGRVGSFVGPLLVGGLVAAAWAVTGVYGVLAGLCVVGGLAAVAMRPARETAAVEVPDVAGDPTSGAGSTA